MRRSLTIPLLLSLACGGSGGGSGGAVSEEVARGVITEVGSATVNGKLYEIDKEIVEFPADTLDLAEGMKVTIFARSGSDRATRVVYDDDLEGPIEAILPIGPDTKELTILGQTVVIDRADTVFAAPLDFDGLAPLDVVEVSGLRDGDGAIVATRIVDRGMLGATPIPVELRGRVASLDAMLGRFEIGGVEIGFDPTGVGTDLSGVPNAALAEDDLVEVRGSFDPSPGLGQPDVDAAGGGLIEIVDPVLGEDVSNVRLEGIASDLVSFSDFAVGGQPVNAGNLGVVFEPDASIVGEGARLQITGRLTSGRLVASRVSQRRADVRIQAEIADAADVDVTAGTLRLLGSLDVDVVPSTRRIGFDTLGELAAGTLVDVRGIAIQGRVRATRIESVAPGAFTEARLIGAVGVFDGTAGSFTILGHPISVDGATSFEEFPDVPALSDEEDFFAYLSLGGPTFLDVVAPMGDTTLLDNAEHVELRREVQVVVAAAVADDADVDDAADRVTLLGGVRIEVFPSFPQTTFVPCGPIPQLNEVDDLIAGDFIEVRGTRRFGGAVRAISIQCFDAAGDVRLRGRVERPEGSAGFTILGAGFPTDAGTDFTGFPGFSGTGNQAAFDAFLDTHPTAVLDVRDAADLDATAIDAADEVFLEDDGN